VVGVAGRVVLRGRRGCSGGGGAALSYRGLLGGRRGRGLDVAALHLDAAQALPVSPLQQQVALRRRATASAPAAAAARGASRLVVLPRLPLHRRSSTVLHEKMEPRKFQSD
jgi:hypothetical protein